MKESTSFEALMDPGEADDFFDVADLPAFDPRATNGFDRTNALWLAEFSRLIYRRDSDEFKRPAGFRTRDEFLGPHGWRQERADFINLDGTRAALFVNLALPCGVLVFRGTSSLGDALTDAQFLPDNWLQARGKVHRGFRDALERVWNRIEGKLRQFPHPVFFTGHSLGAGLATLAVSRALIENKMPRPAALYTFGSPRVGDAVFTSTLSGVYHCRVVNDKDIVTTIPPPLLFRHDGELHHLKPDGFVEVRARDADEVPSLSSAILSGTSALLKDIGAGLRTAALPQHLTDHAPRNYTARLQAAR
ncbi:MAG TPA: lipase family protein [Verrucomicrobiae bacterium]|nr:lipase family protein [Verrucomicrobiae bacterium]